MSEETNAPQIDVQTLDSLHEDLALVALEKGLKNHIAAINKIRKKEGKPLVRDSVGAGVYKEIEINLGIKLGAITVSKDTETVSEPTVDAWELVACLLTLQGHTPDAEYINTLLTFMGSHDYKPQKKALKESVSAFLKKNHGKKPTNKTTKGMVRVKEAVVQVNELKLL